VNDAFLSVVALFRAVDDMVCLSGGLKRLWRVSESPVAFLFG
jgi:hypothetical protein